MVIRISDLNRPLRTVLERVVQAADVSPRWSWTWDPANMHNLHRLMDATATPTYDRNESKSPKLIAAALFRDVNACRNPADELDCDVSSAPLHQQ